MIRGDYGYIQRITTRWMDNDVYGHINNVVYYSYFDTVINTWLIERTGLDIHAGAQIGLCAESHCRFIGPLAFPGIIDAALRVEHLGKSSVRYGIGLFSETAEEAAAQGWFVHVFVDRQTRKSALIPAEMRAALQTLIMETSA